MLKTDLFRLALLFFMGGALVSCSSPPVVTLLEPFIALSDSNTDEDTVIVNSDNSDTVMIVGQIIPRDATLSISYIGACGQSYFRDIKAEGGIFTEPVPIAFVRDIELLVTGTKNTHSSKFIHLKDVGKLKVKKGDECDYMKVRRYNEEAPRVYVVEESCYEIGYKYGSCVSRRHLNIPCKPGTDVAIPFRCRDRFDTQEGIEAGRL